METTTAFGEEDLTALVWLADGWGMAEWTDGFQAPSDLGNDDHDEVGRRMVGRRVVVAEARDKTSQKLAELVEEGKVPDEMFTALWEALTAWADHRRTVGEVTRNSLKHGTDSLGLWQLREEDTDQELRLVWAEPLVALADLAKSQRPQKVTTRPEKD